MKGKVDRQVAGNARGKESKQDMKAKTLTKFSASNECSYSEARAHIEVENIGKVVASKCL